MYMNLQSVGEVTMKSVEHICLENLRVIKWKGIKIPIKDKFCYVSYETMKGQIYQRSIILKARLT